MRKVVQYMWRQLSEESGPALDSSTAALASALSCWPGLPLLPSIWGAPTIVGLAARVSLPFWEAFISSSFLKRLSLLNMESYLDKDLF